MVAYGVGLIGLIVSACLYLHVAAKYLFVRILRNTRHLQSNTIVHWSVWLGCTFGLVTISFVLAEAIPIFNYLIALTGSVCFAPLAIILPAWFWLYDHGHWRKGGVAKMAAYYLHYAIIALGIFICVAGTYATADLIKEAYASGEIGSAFSCADNSNSS